MQTAIAYVTWAARLWPWWLRLALAGVVLTAIAPAGHRVLPQSPQTVETQQPLMCVHTDLINEVDEWKIQRSLQLVREMGAPTVVEFFPWAYIEPQPGRYNWYQADRIVRHAQQQGVRIIARMGFVPQWARPDDTTFNTIEDDAFPDFAAFVATFAARYAGIIDHLIIWNEPNLAFEWGYQPVDPARYVRMLQALYGPVREANPDVIILAAALAPTLEQPGSPHGLDDRLFLEGMYRAGAAPYFDALALHTYGFTRPATEDPAPDRLNFRRAELLIDIMREHDDPDKPVFITESGWNDNPRWVHAVRPSQRVAYTLDAFRWADEHWDWLDALCIWLLRYPRPAGSYRDNFTLITPDFQNKPIYEALRAYARGWPSEEESWLPPPVE